MTVPDRPKYRLHVDSPLAAGQTVALTPAQAHYLATVMRARAGETVALFNGRDGEWRSVVTDLGRKGGTLEVGDRLREQTVEGDLWLLFAPLKKDATDMVVEKATELGVARLLPVMTDNTAASRLNTDRARANAIEAAEQCERLSVPTVDEPAPLARLLAGWDAARPLLVADETGRGEPLAAVAARLEGAALAVLIGPEGGFSHSELDALRRLPFVVPVGLGPRILRAETAALAALACIQAVAGDWRSGGPAFR